MKIAALKYVDENGKLAGVVETGVVTVTELLQHENRIFSEKQFLLRWPVAQVACGWHHCIVRRIDGEVWGWGSNSVGQLGLPVRLESTTVSIPVKITTLKSAVLVAAGQARSAALLSTPSKCRLVRIGRDAGPMPVVNKFINEEMPTTTTEFPWIECSDCSGSSSDEEEPEAEGRVEITEILSYCDAAVKVKSIAVNNEFTMLSQWTGNETWSLFAAHKSGKYFSYCNDQKGGNCQPLDSPKICCWQEREDENCKRVEIMKRCPEIVASEANCFHFVEPRPCEEN